MTVRPGRRLPGPSASTASSRSSGARSVPRQEPPYRPLAEVVRDQHVFELRDVTGTMVGFRFPDFAEGLEVSGYHLHFITADLDRGGHVLAMPAAERAGRDRSRPMTSTSSCRRASTLPAAELAESTREALRSAERDG